MLTKDKAAKATKYGKIALGVVGAGLAAKEYLKSKMKKKESPDDEMNEKPESKSGWRYDEVQQRIYGSC
jgi:hypothetical protein